MSLALRDLLIPGVHPQASDPSPKSPQLVPAQPYATWTTRVPAPLPGRCPTAGPGWALCPLGAEGPSGPKFCHALTAPEPESECITEPGPGGQRRRAPPAAPGALARRAPEAHTSARRRGGPALPSPPGETQSSPAEPSPARSDCSRTSPTRTPHRPPPESARRNFSARAGAAPPRPVPAAPSSPAPDP